MQKKKLLKRGRTQKRTSSEWWLQNSPGVQDGVEYFKFLLKDPSGFIGSHNWGGKLVCFCHSWLVPGRNGILFLLSPLSICAPWEVAAPFPQLNHILTTMRSVGIYSSAVKSQLFAVTGQATSDRFLWRLQWVCPCQIENFCNTHAGRSKNGWRKEGAARCHCSSLFLPLPTLQRSAWSGLSGSGEDIARRAWRWDWTTCSNRGDKDRNTPFPALDGTLFGICV